MPMFLRHLMSKLQGKAKRSIYRKEFLNLDALMKHLKQRFAAHNTYTYYNHLLQTARMKQGETVHDFFEHINVLLGGAEAALNEEVGDAYHVNMLTPLLNTALDMFIKGLPADICRAVDSTRSRTLELALEEAVRLEKRMAANIIPDTHAQRNSRETGFRQREPTMERAYYPSEDTRPHPRANYVPFIGYITETRPYKCPDGTLEYDPSRNEYVYLEDFPREYYPQEGEGDEEANRPWVGYIAPKPPGILQGAPPNYYDSPPSHYTYSRQEYE
uniref:Retrotransposon gag domain-containing protein n=1 Tax=Trichogramma kaykai TaxID=54128 RepID=A0ABD2W9X3_9HYME